MSHLGLGPLIPADQQIFAGLAGLALSGLIKLSGFAAAFGLRICGLSSIGIRRTSKKWLLAAAGLSLASWVLGVGSSALFVALSGDQQDVQSGYQAAAAGGVVAYLATLFLGSVVTPIGEEFFFRGVIANALGRYGGPVAAIGSAALFAVAHGISPVMPIAFVIGIVTAVLFRRSGSVWPGVMVHGVNNGIASTFSLIWAALM